MAMETASPLERELEYRLRQQSLIAELGLVALGGGPIEALQHEVCRIAAEGLGTRFAKIMEFLPGENRLLVRAGIGWRDGVVGHVTIGCDLASPAGFALKTGKPAISNDLTNDPRFRTPKLLTEHGVTRAINVIVRSGGGPDGVLEVDSTQEGRFTEHDVAFLQAAANLLGVAGERMRAERAAGRWRHIFEHAGFGVAIADPTTDRLELVNPSFAETHGYRVDEMVGMPMAALFPPEERERAAAELKRTYEQGRHQFESWHVRRDGTRFPVAVDMSVPYDDRGDPLYCAALVEDITQWQEREEALLRATRDKQLLLDELNHRVKNNLQMVTSLIALEARRVTDPGIRAGFDAISDRIGVLGRLHALLYRSGGATTLDFGVFLRDFAEGLSELFSHDDARVRLLVEAESIMLNLDRTVPLGLVVNELVTNSLKHAFPDGRAGTVRIVLRRRTPDTVALVVADDGVGGDGETGSGLGQRLLAALAAQVGAKIEVQRRAGTSVTLLFEELSRHEDGSEPAVPGETA